MLLRSQPYRLALLLGFGLALSVSCTGNPPGTDTFHRTELAPSAAPGACGPLAAQAYEGSDNFMTDEYLWYDAQCQPRRADLTRNEQLDPTGNYGGLMHRMTYQFQNAERDCVGTSDDHPGFGGVVNHTGTPAEDSLWHAGTHSSVFLGAYHAVHQFQWTYNIASQPVTVTVQWVFVTGRDHPIWAITYDLTRASVNGLNADTRAPYGEIAWDGGLGANVDGEGWGDHFKFKTLATPVTLESGWDYTEANTVPYVWQWSNSVDAEMGVVQTQNYQQHDGGGYDFFSQWQQTSAAGPMPATSSWTYQLNQYELDADTTSKRLAWGSNFGAVGQQHYLSYGNDRTLSGYPYQSYATFVAMGPHQAGTVTAAVGEVENMLQTTLTATAHAIIDRNGPAGVARTDLQTYSPPGYNPIYAAWSLTATAPLDEAVGFSLSPPAAGIVHPLILIHGWTAAAPTSVTVSGVAQVAGVGYFASVDTATQTLWLTLNASFSGATAVTVAP